MSKASKESSSDALRGTPPHNSKPNTTSHVWTAELRKPLWAPLNGGSILAFEVRSCGHRHRIQAAAQRCASQMKRQVRKEETAP